MKLVSSFSFPLFGLLVGTVLFLGFVFLPTFPIFEQALASQIGEKLTSAEISVAARSMQRGFGVLFLMVIWWLTEAVPIPITALVPVVTVPFLNLYKSSAAGLTKIANVDILSNYADPIVFLFLGGFILASAMTYQRLDRRITFLLLSVPFFTHSPKKLLLGLMLATAFISMWINNTAVAAMLMPIGVGIAYRIEGLNKDGTPTIAAKNFASSIIISIAYSASIGGIATIVGSTPNGIAVSMLKQQQIADMNFVSWLGYGLPTMLAILLFAWVYLGKVLPLHALDFEGVNERMKEELQKLGKIKAGEQKTLWVFLLTAFCWLVLPFLKDVFPPQIDTVIRSMDTWVVAMLSAFALFFVPESLATGKPIITWEHAQKTVDWGSLVLFGGGLAMSEILFETQCVAFMSLKIQSWLGNSSLLLLVLVMVVFVNLLTEVSSNTAVASMMMPLAISLAISLGFSPVPVAIAIAFAGSMAFMLPIATPPNAIAYGTGLLQLKQMIRIGVVLNIVSSLVITLWVVWSS